MYRTVATGPTELAPATITSGAVTPKKRKRGGHNSACWICQKDHRACDSGRPCKRCINIGTADACCNPVPKKETKPKRRKFYMVPSNAFASAPSSTTRTREPIIIEDEPDPQPQVKINQFGGWQWQQVPSALPDQPPEALIAPSQRKKTQNSTPAPKIQRTRKAAQQTPKIQPPPFSPFTSEPLPSNDAPPQVVKREQDQLMLALLLEVKQLNETTAKLKEEQTLLGSQLAAFRKPTAFPLKEEYDDSLDLASDDLSYLYTPHFQPFEQQALVSNIPNSSASSLAQLDFAEMQAIVPTTHHNSDFAVSRDYVRFAESSFLPFVLEDATKPFAVIKPSIINLELFREFCAAGPERINKLAAACDMKNVIRMLMIAPSPAFCDLLQYTEEELMGDNVEKVKAPHAHPKDDKWEMVGCMKQQPPNIRVGPIVRGRPSWLRADGKLLHVFARAQFFYDENGFPNFIIASLQSWKVDENDGKVIWCSWEKEMDQGSTQSEEEEGSGRSPMGWSPPVSPLSPYDSPFSPSTPFFDNFDMNDTFTLN